MSAYSSYTGLSLLLFHPDTFEADYGCRSVLTANATVPPAKQSHPILAGLQLALALTSELLYALCMCSIWRHRQVSCYKILFYIGVVDMCGLVVGAILCSLQSFTGITYCHAPVFIYICGGFAMSFWFAETTAEFILAVDRCLELLAPKTASFFFAGNRTWLMMLIPSVYATLAWLFTRPVMFSTSDFAFFFNPYQDYALSTRLGTDYTNNVHTFNNTLVSLTLVTTYSVFCLFWVGRMLKMLAIAKPQVNKQTTAATAAAARAVQMTFVQVMLISMFNACAAGLGVYMEHFYIPSALIVVAQMTYVLTHAAPPFIYLVCNQTIRADVLALLQNAFAQNKGASSGLTMVVAAGKPNTTALVTTQQMRSRQQQALGPNVAPNRNWSNIAQHSLPSHPNQPIPVA